MVWKGSPYSTQHLTKCAADFVLGVKKGKPINFAEMDVKKLS